MSTNTRSTEVVKAQKPRALEVMSARMNVEPTKLLETLKNTVFKGATNEEMLALVVVANEYKLNPFLKEIFAFPSKGGGIVPVVSIDGWNKMMLRADNFDGIEFAFDSDEGQPKSCTATIHLKDRSHPVRVTEYYSECFRNTEPWKMMPRRMLRHKALIQAARVAFGFSGVYDEDEGRDQADTARFSAAKPVFEHAQPKALFAVPDPAPEPAKETEARPEADGEKTRFFNALCQEHKMELGELLNYLGAAGYATFEDVNDAYVAAIKKNSKMFADMVKGNK